VNHQCPSIFGSCATITICVLNLISTQSRNSAFTDVGGRHLLEAMRINSTVTSIHLVSLSYSLVCHDSDLPRRATPPSAQVLNKRLQLSPGAIHFLQLLLLHPNQKYMLFALAPRFL
jgi:hypothetical protein